MKYVEPLFRPPGEAESLIFQVAYGCPHNRCRFCGMYKGVRYALRPEAELLAEIARAGREYPEAKRIFLADGDAMALPFDRLKRILEAVNEAFGRVARINTYANGSSILRRSEEELAELRKRKLHTLYLGLESGSASLLEQVDKGETPDAMAEAVNRAQALDFRCSVMVLIGLGGVAYSGEHAAATAECLNRMQPRLLSALRFIEVPGTDMFAGYRPLSEHQAVDELRRMIAALRLERTVFRANHSSNPIPLEGRFPQDREPLLAELDRLLASGALSRTGPGTLPLFL